MPYDSKTKIDDFHGFEIAVECIQHRQSGPWEYEVTVRDPDGRQVLPPVRSHDGGKPTFEEAAKVGIDQGRRFVDDLRR
ncbi:DUF6566 family protein [Cupriavidus respiraculi]|uniref:DUF6566 family protein n=1 Tax=Cupriavidus respiraculi TaxID=195930 RepID=UPI001CC7F922|nr:DUF6566 family protein [Cupriavidus respiraculi]